MNPHALLANLSGALLIVAVFALPALFGVGVIFLVRRIAKSKAKAVSAGPMTRASRENWGCAIAFLAVFALFGAVIFALMFVGPMLRVLQARSWVAVPCVIESSRVVSSSDSDGTTYRPEVIYTYRYGKVDYRGDRYDFMGGSSSGYAGKQAIVERFPAGATSHCWVNPRAPGEAVLERGFVATMWFGLIPLAFVGFGVLGLAHTIRQRRRMQKPPVPVTDEMAPDETSGIELRPEHSRLAKALGLFAVAAFWNGISWTIFLSCLRDREWFGILFLSLFVLIGAGLALATVYQWLALANPAVHVTLRPGRLRHGQLQTLSWRLSGAAYRVRTLTITLEGRESATYTRGTSSVTDTSTFARIVLVESGTAAEIHAGETNFSLPDFAAPGFAAKHNKVQWFLRVQGTIRFWPDVDDEFPVTVCGATTITAVPPDADATAEHTTHSEDRTLALGVSGGRLAFAPGKKLSGVAGWSLPQAPASVELRLFWYTQGKGTRDVQVVATECLSQPQAGELRPFEFMLPQSPWSLDGRLVSLVWAIELIVDPGGRSVRQELVISPTFAPVQLPEALPDHDTQPRWARWLKTGK